MHWSSRSPPLTTRRIGFARFAQLLVLALVWAIYQIRVRQLRHDFALTLEARVGERTSIARELHDTCCKAFRVCCCASRSFPQLLPDRPMEAKEQLDKTIDRAAEAITEGRDAVQGLRASTVKRMISHGPSIRSVRNSQLIQPTTGLRHFASQLKATREICIPYCVTKSTGLPLRHFGTPSVTPRRSRSRWKSDMTINSSGCVCGTMEKASIQQSCRERGLRDTSV